MDETNVADKQIEDWMRHGLSLAEVRLAKLPGSRDYSREFEVSLQREVKLREFVFRYRYHPQMLDGSALVWWRYCDAHARLQIRRYSNQITEELFRADTSKLRRDRSAADKTAQHGLWLKPERKFA